MVKRLTVNQDSLGSSPRGGAKGAFESEKLAELLGILGDKMAGNRILVLRESPFITKRRGYSDLLDNNRHTHWT